MTIIRNVTTSVINKEVRWTGGKGGGREKGGTGKVEGKISPMQAQVKNSGAATCQKIRLMAVDELGSRVY